ncbi:PAAR domain-containing protein [Magnetofaba australis]|uniref:PAAR domain-containing protein n=1 Tax=Magnetofaba australis TaxID=1472297 RepID=UPI000A19F1D3|nr:PAAR domain-containing protein [Magnetofaba australis]
MPKCVRLGDICTGHGCWPARPNVGASPNVFINGRAAHRVGDPWAAHTCPPIPETHASVMAGGSPNVIVNGSALARIGDPVACGSAAASGSHNVFANGG